MTFLAVSIAVNDLDQLERDLALARACHAEMVELRLDYLPRPTCELVRQVVTAARKTAKPIVATCRPVWEGGQFQGDEPERHTLLAQAAKAGANFLDLELRCLDQQDFDPDALRVSSSAKVILSSHDFDAAPADAATLIENLRRPRPAIAKLAYKADTINHCFDALDILHNRRGDQPEAIALAMGEPGLITRLLAKRLGAFLTFARLNTGAECAPGQITLQQMRKIYRWDAINSLTALCGVIGYPIAHSLSPAIHNGAFDVTGWNGLYLPLLVPPTYDDFCRFLDGLRERPWLGVRGLSVTIPHKRHALQYVQKTGGNLEELAELIGAVNTLAFEPDGTISGYNTDYAGALQAITKTLNIKAEQLRGMHAAVIGAGGVARAIVAALTNAHLNVTIYNRTQEKARSLAHDFDCKYAPLDDLHGLHADLVVNATSLGMTPNVDTCPVPPDVLRPDMIVFDTVYNPRQTLLLRHAQAANARVVDGLSMFVNQAALQFERFTGQPAPRQHMRQIVEAQFDTQDHA